MLKNFIFVVCLYLMTTSSIMAKDMQLKTLKILTQQMICVVGVLLKTLNALYTTLWGILL